MIIYTTTIFATYLYLNNCSAADIDSALDSALDSAVNNYYKSSKGNCMIINYEGKQLSSVEEVNCSNKFDFQEITMIEYNKKKEDNK